MRDYRRYFEGKKITVMGLGLLGRGLGDAQFLAECGAEMLVTDTKSAEQLAASVAALRTYPNVRLRLGGHRLEDFTSCDMVLKAAGVRLDAPEIAAAKAAGVPVAMSTALFAKYAAEAGTRIVGVTGTRGKSTVSHMIYHTLTRAAPRQSSGRERHVFLGGNVRGLSTLALLPQVEAGDIAVLELDSWQLQGFGDLQISPHVAVFTNLMPDHQNYYRNMDEYFDDKANLFRFQKSRQGDALLVGAEIEHRVRAAHPPVEPTVPGGIPADWILQVPGEHNRQNAALAASALLSLGITADKIREGLESFEAVEGRLQFVGEKSGVKIYNDNNATTPEATIAALRALSGDTTSRHLALIAGGSDKGLALDELAAEIRDCGARVILLSHPLYSGSARLMAALGAGGVAYEEAPSLEEAVAKGMEGMKGKEGTLLFSPAFASFGMFKNEYDRNDVFIRIVQEYAAANGLS